MIKKILFGFALIASMASCTDDYTDWGQPQTNPQEDAVAFGDGSVAPVALIDFANIAEEQEMVQVCAITAPTASDAAYAPQYALALGGTSIDMDAAGNVKVADLKSYIESNFGKAPVERTIDAAVSMWENNGATAVKLTSGVFQVKAKLDAPEISEHYYLIGQPSAWDPTCTTMPFNHSGANVYDDPVFTVTFSTDCANENGEIWFAVADDKTVESGDWSMVFGALEGNGNNNVGETGFIARRNVIGNDGSFLIKPGDAKMVKMTLNMMDGTYLIETLSFGEFFYEIGGESGWGTSHALRGANFDGKYRGYYYLDSEFKFKPLADKWDGDYEYDGEGKIADNGGANCPAPDPAGFYQIDVDLAAGTYALTLVESISAIGDFNGWGGDVDLTYNAETGAWEATGVDLSGGVKFRMNHEWAISWGGNGSGDNFDDLTANDGKNLNVEEGTYDIQLFISYEGNNRVVLTKK